MTLEVWSPHFCLGCFLLNNRPVHYEIYSEQSGNGTGSFHQCSALNLRYFPHGATDPSRLGLPHYRGVKITL